MACPRFLPRPQAFQWGPHHFNTPELKSSLSVIDFLIPSLERPSRSVLAPTMCHILPILLSSQPMPSVLAPTFKDLFLEER